MRFVYKHSGIKTRYSVLNDYSLPASEWKFFIPTENLEPFPSIEKRMKSFREHAARLSIKAINKSWNNYADKINVSIVSPGPNAAPNILLRCSLFNDLLIFSSTNKTVGEDMFPKSFSTS